MKVNRSWALTRRTSWPAFIVFSLPSAGAACAAGAAGATVSSIHLFYLIIYINQQVFILFFDVVNARARWLD